MARISEYLSATSTGPWNRHFDFPTVAPSLDPLLSDPLFFAPVIGTVRTGDQITIVRFEPGSLPPEARQKVLEIVVCRVWKIEGTAVHLVVMQHCDLVALEAAMMKAKADAAQATQTISEIVSEPEAKRGPGRPRKEAA